MIKTKIFIVLLFFVSQISFSQTEKLIQGKVLSDNNVPIKEIEVINLVSKKTTVTDDTGTFSMLVEAEDVLIFFSKTYEYNKILLTQEDIDKNNLIVTLIKKTKELPEIIIKKSVLPVALDFNSQKIVYQHYFDEEKLVPKNRFVYDGTIESGMDFVKIGKELLYLFRKKKTSSNMEFKELALSTYDQSFFTKTLKLESDQVNLFLEYCDSDPKAETIFDDNDVLKVMDFLMTKNTEFKQLPK